MRPDAPRWGGPLGVLARGHRVATERHRAVSVRGGDLDGDRERLRSPRRSTIATGRGTGLRLPRRPRPPPSRRAISSSGRCVAERPMRWQRRVSRPRDRRQPPRGARAREKEVRSALARGDRVDLVDDDRVDRREDLARVRREQEVERLGRRDEDVRRARIIVARSSAGRVAGAHRDGGGRCAPPRSRRGGDSGERARRLRSTSTASALSGET